MTQTRSRTRSLIAWWAFAALGLASWTDLAQAETYRVDLIVFADLSGTAGESGVPAAEPSLHGTLEPADAAGLRAVGITLLPDEQFALGEEWQHLRNSKLYRPLVRLAWTQADPPTERGPSLHIVGGPERSFIDPVTQATSVTHEVDGSVALLLGRYLHLDADLRYNIVTGSGQPLSYVLHERRKMRRDELHHLDGVRVGVLARVTAATAAPSP